MDTDTSASTEVELSSRIARLEKKVADQTRTLNALYELLEVAADPADLPARIQEMLQQVLTAVHGDAAVVHLLDEAGIDLQLIAAHGVSAEFAADLVRRGEDGTASFLEQHMPDNEPLFLPEWHRNGRLSGRLADSYFHSFLGIPVTFRSQVRGVLSFLSRRAAPEMTETELDLLVSVGDQIGFMVENARLRQKAEQLKIMEERNRLARELHDSVTQSLYSVTLFAEAGRTLAEAGELERAAGYFPDVLETGQQALKEMRLLVHKLRPPILEEVGLIRALQQRLNAVEGRAGIETKLDVDPAIQLPHEIEEGLYAIAQEALNNGIKHAAARRVVVTLQRDGIFVELRIQDDGCGFDPEAALQGGGLGLTSMQERARMMAGELTITSEPEQGTTVCARVLTADDDLSGSASKRGVTASL